MPVRVELTTDAAQDLRRYVDTDALPRILAKLLRLEEVGRDAGQPLGRELTGWRKIVVGDRADSEVYDEAQRRVAHLAQARPEAASLAAIMFQISESKRAAKKAKRRR